MTNIETGKDGVERYFTVTHKTKTGQTRNLKRTSQQLVLVLAQSEMTGDPDIIPDDTDNEEENPDNTVQADAAVDDDV